MFQFNEIFLWCLSTHRIFSAKVWQLSLSLIKLSFICFHTSPTSPILLKGKDCNLIPVLSTSTIYIRHRTQSKYSENSLDAHYLNGIYEFMLCLSIWGRLFEVMAHTSLYRSSLQPLWCSKSKRSSINLLICKIILQLETVFLLMDFFFWTDFTIKHKLHLCFYKTRIWSSNFIFYSQQGTQK